MQVAHQIGHSKIETTKNIYGNPWELHQTGAFALVACSAGFAIEASRCPWMWPDLAGCAMIPSGA